MWFTTTDTWGSYRTELSSIMYFLSDLGQKQKVKTWASNGIPLEIVAKALEQEIKYNVGRVYTA